MSPVHERACAQRSAREQLRDVAAKVWSLLGGKKLFQRGEMRPSPNASIAARPRRAPAASHVRCRHVHKERAIRLPPGRMSTIAAYDPRPRIERARRARKPVPTTVTASSWVRMPRRLARQIECPSWRSSRVREISPRTTVPPRSTCSPTTTWVAAVVRKKAARSETRARPSACQSSVGTRSHGVMM